MADQCSYFGWQAYKLSNGIVEPVQLTLDREFFLWILWR